MFNRLFTGMPAGHPFQGSQPKHLDAPSVPAILPRSMTDENDFDHEKMMRYDDFSNEDVGEFEKKSKKTTFFVCLYISVFTKQ